MKRIAVLAIIVLILAGSLFLPFRIPRAVDATGEIVPAREWILQTDLTGYIFSVLRDHTTERTGNLFMTELIRGDAVSLNVSPRIISGNEISAGDTVAMIASYETERDLSELKNELLTQQASLRAAESGEKRALVEAAQRRLDQAREMLAEQERITKRLNELQSSGFVTAQDYEIAKSTEDQYRLAAGVAEADLASVRTGVKPEEVEFIRASIRSTEEEIAVVQSKLDAFTITSPLSGTVMHSLAPDTLAWIADTSSYLAIIPLRLGLEQGVTPGLPVRFIVPGGGKIDGRVIGLSNTAANAMKEQVLVVTASLDPATVPLYPGMILECHIKFEPLTIRRYIVRLSGQLF
jgi:multidrug efflux pump subunit AcrA (membrane-fusion protein)